MVERQLRQRGITDERVLQAMARVPRELFVPEGMRELAYEDGALPIGSGQTISQPFIVAAICSLLELRGDEHVLDVGTGSGYQAAVLAELARRGDDHRARSRALRASPRRARRCRVRQRRRPARRRVAGCAREGAVRRDRRRGRGADGARCALRAARSRAAGSSSRAAIAGGRSSSRSSRHRTARSERASIPCRFVPLVGAGGFRSG